MQSYQIWHSDNLSRVGEGLQESTTIHPPNGGEAHGGTNFRPFCTLTPFDLELPNWRRNRSMEWETEGAENAGLENDGPM